MSPASTARHTATAGSAPVWAQDLKARLRGQLRTDPGTRALYATDASNYRHVPTAVVFPRDADDVVATVETARAHGVPITQRGAGTSIAGNACGPGIVLDFAKHMNQILDIDPHTRTARVQPGVVLDQLQAALKPHGLIFGPDPSTHSRCTIGGMIGNNSCGTHSVAWGKTVDNVRSLEVLLTDGTRLEVGATSAAELDALCARGDRIGQLYRELRDLAAETEPLIKTGFPDIPRRVSGYNLDQLLPEQGFHLARALVGTEGSCATVLAATVDLVEAPPVRALAVLGFADTYAAADEVPALRGMGALAIEGLSPELVDVVRQRNPSSPSLPLLPEARSWLLVETGGATLDEALAAAQTITEAMTSAESAIHTDPASIRALWKVREEGSGYSTRLADGTERWSGLEDAAVPVESLGAYLRDFNALLDAHGYRGVTYGHYGDGCIHVRVDFDLRSTTGATGYRAFMEQAADTVARHGGSISGEHGDGQARSELLARMYSPAMLEAFRRFRAAFDPQGLHNPGIISEPRALDADLRLLVADPTMPTGTKLALHDDGGDLGSATRRCVGMGVCLNHSGGVMCPSYRATREEQHSTRGRAHLLFEMLAGQTITDGWRSPEVGEALDLCLSCKGCKTDCPVGVDMASYKAEFLHHHYRGRLRPASHYSMGFLPLWLGLARKTLGPAAARVANPLMRSTGPLKIMSTVLKKLGGIAPERDLPALAPTSLQDWFRRTFPTQRAAAGNAGAPASARNSGTAGAEPVVLFPDSFTNHFDPHVGRDAVVALRALGNSVRMPTQSVCCGLTWASTGQIDTARRIITHTARVLRPQVQAGLPVIGLEPSCTAFLRNDALEVAPDDPDVAALAEATKTFAEWVAPHRDRWQSRPESASEGGEHSQTTSATAANPALVQVHCHQYAELGFDPDKATLESLGVKPTLLEGCCGLAGNFGFEAGHYDVSEACAEHALLPAVRNADPGTPVVADGFSCRTQLRQLSDAEPEHLATLVARALE